MINTSIRFCEPGKVASFLSVRVPQTFHIVHADAEDNAQRLEYVGDSPLRINGATSCCAVRSSTT